MTDAKRPAESLSLYDDLNDLVRLWAASSDDPYCTKGAQAGYYFAASALREVLRRHGVLTDAAEPAKKASSDD